VEPLPAAAQVSHSQKARSAYGEVLRAVSA
jgi:hypothetical protein